MPTFTVTCHTDGCMNQGIPIELEYAEEFGVPDAYCGPCGQPITDAKGTENAKAD